MLPPKRDRKSTTWFEWSSQGRVFSVSDLIITLSSLFAKTLVHRLPACELRKSGIPDSGYGVFLKRAARCGSPQKAGENLSSLLIFSLGSLWYRVLQGLGTHLKVIPTFAFCYNSRPSADYPLEWFLRNIKMGGFANTKPRRECNAKFETRGDKVYVVTTKPIRAGEEVFVFYHCKQQEDRMKLKLYKKKIAKRMNRKVWMNTKKKWREREQNIAIWPKNSIA